MADAAEKVGNHLELINARAGKMPPHGPHQFVAAAVNVHIQAIRRTVPLERVVLERVKVGHGAARRARGAAAAAATAAAAGAVAASTVAAGAAEVNLGGGEKASVRPLRPNTMPGSLMPSAAARSPSAALSRMPPRVVVTVTPRWKKVEVVTGATPAPAPWGEGGSGRV